jgi:hypothetical protein
VVPFEVRQPVLVKVAHYRPTVRSAAAVRSSRAPAAARCMSAAPGMYPATSARVSRSGTRWVVDALRRTAPSAVVPRVQGLTSYDYSTR